MSENPTRRAVFLWAGLTLVAALAVFAAPLVADAAGLFQDPEMEGDPVLAEVEPKQQGSEVLVASGTTPEGIEYRLTAYQSDRGLCVNFTRSDVPQMESGGCGLGLRGEENHPDSPYLSPTIATVGEGSAFVYGTTTAEVESVAVTLKNGKVKEVPTKAAAEKEKSSAALGGEFKFFATTVPPPLILAPDGQALSPSEDLGAPMHSVDTIEALNASGVEVDEYKSHEPPKDVSAPEPHQHVNISG